MKQNILELLSKSMNDCDIVLNDGSITSEKKYIDSLKKEYLSKVKNDEIDLLTISFGQYVAEKQATDLSNLYDIINLYLNDKYDELLEKLMKEQEEISEESDINE